MRPLSNTELFSANGQPEQLGERACARDALGRLAEVRQAGALLARYPRGGLYADATFDIRGRQEMGWA